VHLGEATVRTLPKLGIAHSAQEVVDLFLLVLAVGLDFQAVDLLQNLCLLVQEQLECKLLLLLAQLGAALNFLGLIEAPSVQLVAQDLEVFTFLGVHTPLDLLFVLDFLLVSEVGLLVLELVVLVGASLAEGVGSAAGEPGAHVALDLQGDRLTLFVPHRRRHILARVDDFVVSCVDVEARLLHLDTEFAHHLRRLGLVLVSLDLSLDLVRVVVARLISLSEGMMISDSRAVVAEATEVGLRALLFLNGNRHDFDLVVGEANFDFELGRHLELIRFDRVVVILLLLGDLVPLLSHHLLFHLLLLELLDLLLGVLARGQLSFHELLLTVRAHHWLSVHVHHVRVLHHLLLLHSCGFLHELLLMLLPIHLLLLHLLLHLLLGLSVATVRSRCRVGRGGDLARLRLFHLLLLLSRGAGCLRHWLLLLLLALRGARLLLLLGLLAHI